MRSPVTLRSARAEDAVALAGLWRAALRRADRADQADDVRRIIAETAADPDRRLVVAECEGQVAGAVFLEVTTISPINLDACVHTVSPHVADGFRRRGVGRALIEAGVAFAEERGICHVASAAFANSRDANRFMARLGLAAEATWRLAPTELVRAKVDAQQPALRTTTRHRTQLVAARRTLRRRQSAGASS